MTAAENNAGLALFATWDVAADDSLGKDLLDLAQIHKGDSKPPDVQEESSIVDLVNLSKFVVLEKSPEFPGPCIIQATVSEGAVQKVFLVCDVPKIEVYRGAVQEISSYWRTIRGSPVEEFSELDTKVFRYDIDCSDLSTSNLELKLHTLMDSILVIGLHVFLQASAPFAPEPNRIDFSHVQQMLSSSSVPLTDEAQRALKFLQNAPPQVPPKMPPFEEMMKMFSAKTSLEANGNSQKPSEDLRSYLDVRLREMEARLQRHFDERLLELEERQNQKLDQILNILTINK